VSRIVVIADAALPPEVVNGWREVCMSYSTSQAEEVSMITTGGDGLEQLDTFLETAEAEFEVELISPDEASVARAKNAPMSAADFIWREDGRPDWGAMWEGFCELALYGGPPHRGEAQALREVTPEEAELPPVEDYDAIAEIRRGIWETTRLYTEMAEPGWVAITCQSRKMAAWLCASIVLENVDARFEEERLYVPAAYHFKLKDQVKSVVTVVAKTNHYWDAHIAETAQVAQSA
jgi:sirohydrochlorin cobaltochelatase